MNRPSSIFAALLVATWLLIGVGVFFLHLGGAVLYFVVTGVPAWLMWRAQTNTVHSTGKRWRRGAWVDR